MRVIGHAEALQRRKSRRLRPRRGLRKQPDLLGPAHQHHIERRIIEAHVKELRHEGELALRPSAFPPSASGRQARSSDSVVLPRPLGPSKAKTRPSSRERHNRETPRRPADSDGQGPRIDDIVNVIDPTLGLRLPEQETDDRRAEQSGQHADRDFGAQKRAREIVEAERRTEPPNNSEAGRRRR